MKTRFTAILLAVMLVFGMTGCASALDSGAAAGGVTIEAIVQANSREALLSKHSAILLHIEGDYADLTDLYVSSESAWENCSLSDYMYLADLTDAWYYVSVNGEKFLSYQWCAMSDEEKAQQVFTADCYEPVISEEGTLTEQIQSVADNGDGTLTVTTLQSAEDSARFMAEGGADYPEVFYTSDKKFVYTLDQATLEILSCV